MKIVLVHGWGCDAHVWDAVRALLDPALSVEAVDLGYFGAVPPAPKADFAVSSAPTFFEPVLAVGHSLGVLWWLMRSEAPWRRLLCINGFPRFTATQGYPGVASRVLERMRAQFAFDPAAVLADFHARCGSQQPAGTLDAARLAEGLAWLADWDARAALAARAADVFALAGTDDPIVPRAMSEGAFAALPPGHCEFVAAPGHLLPVTHPDLCARWIAQLSEEPAA
jgi:pimeloyl-ACP methyl ester carboxylesterase